MEYKFNEIEKKWQEKWKEDNVYKVYNVSDKQKKRLPVASAKPLTV